MNQDQVKEKLLQLDNSVKNFNVIFSGKQSKKVDGLYHPENCEIIIHNKNFENDNELIYTAIHEFAHHVHFTKSAVPPSAKAHTVHFWDIFHRLLFEAETKKIYINVFEKDQKFIELTKKIKANFLFVDGHLMKDFGKLLLEAFALCKMSHVSFEDYVDRVLQLHRSTAKTIMKVYTNDVNPEIGFENMKTVASIRDEDTRIQAQDAFLEGKTPDMVKAQFSSRIKPEDSIENLIAEKQRIEKTIETLTVKLANIEERIDDMSD